MTKSRVWMPAILVGLVLGGLALGSILDSLQEDRTRNSQVTGSRASLDAKREAALSLPGLGGDDLPPFADLVRISEGVAQGVVTNVSNPKWNLPDGEKYDDHKDYPWDPLTFRTVTIRVDRWLYGDGSFGGSEVVLTLSGGRIEQVLTREEIIDLANLEHHPEVDPYEVVPGGIVYSGDDPYGGLTFSVGEEVAVLINRTNFSTPSGVTRVPQVTGHGAGKFLIDSSGGLRNEVVSQPDAPKSLAELEELIAQVKGTS